MVTDPSAGSSIPGRGLIVAGALAVVLVVARMAASVLAPLLLAVFIAIVATPALQWLRRRGMPKWAALGVITFVLLDIGSLLALLTTGALEGFRERLPTYQERFLLLSEQFGRWMEALGAEGSGQAIPELLDPTKVVVGLRFLLSNAGGFFATGLLVLLAVVFILLEANTVPAKLRAAFHLTGEGDARLKRLGGVIKRYMLIKSLTSLATAFCVWFWLYALGIDFVMLWTVLAFFLNFVPVVGNIVMMIPPVLIALVQTDLETTLLVAIGFLVINTGIGSVLEPRIMGKGLGISSLVVFVALLFWGWLFGVVGMFLAVPLTMAVIIALDASPHTRPLAILLGPAVKDPPATVAPQAGGAPPGEAPQTDG
jgi:predicted PurR-regulated permease PerM